MHVLITVLILSERNMAMNIVYIFHLFFSRQWSDFPFLWCHLYICPHWILLYQPLFGGRRSRSSADIRVPQNLRRSLPPRPAWCTRQPDSKRSFQSHDKRYGRTESAAGQRYVKVNHSTYYHWHTFLFLFFLLTGKTSVVTVIFVF